MLTVPRFPPKSLLMKFLFFRSTGVGLSTGSDSELITQCLSMPPPECFRNNLANESESKNGQNGTNGATPITSDTLAPDGLSALEDDSFKFIDPKKRIKKISVIRKSASQSEEEILSRLRHFASLTPLSYSLVVMFNECIYGLRDPFGNRPLCIGKLISIDSKLGPSAEAEGTRKRVRICQIIYIEIFDFKSIFRKHLMINIYFFAHRMGYIKWIMQFSKYSCLLSTRC